MLGQIKILRARDFASFHREVELEFKEGVNFISGLNHAGKSVIGLILSEVLADIGPRSKKTMITDGEREAVIEIETHSNDIIYYSRTRGGDVFREINGVQETSSSITKELEEMFGLLILDKGTPSASDMDLVNIRLSKDSLYFIGSDYGATAQYQMIQQITKTQDLANAERKALKASNKAKKKLRKLRDERREVDKRYREKVQELKSKGDKSKKEAKKKELEDKIDYIEKTKKLKEKLDSIKQVDYELKSIERFDKKKTYAQKAYKLKENLSNLNPLKELIKIDNKKRSYLNKAIKFSDYIGDKLLPSLDKLDKINKRLKKIEGWDEEVLEYAGICPYCGSSIEGGDTCQK